MVAIKEPWQPLLSQKQESGEPRYRNSGVWCGRGSPLCQARLETSTGPGREQLWPNPVLLHGRARGHVDRTLLHLSGPTHYAELETEAQRNCNLIKSIIQPRARAWILQSIGQEGPG